VKWSLIIANLRRLIKDYKLLIGVFSAPVLVVLVIATLTNQSDSIQTIKMGIVNHDGGELSHQMIELLQQDPTLSINVYDREQAHSEYMKKRLPIILTIPEGFFEGALAGEAIVMNVIHVESVPGDTLIRQMEQMVKNLLQEYLVERSTEKADLIHTEVKPIRFVEMPLVNQPNGFMTISFIITFMMFSIIFLSQELIDLRNKHLLFRMFASPNKPSQLTGSLMATLFVFFALQAVILFWLGSIALKAPLLTGNLTGSVLLLACFILLNLSLGVLVMRFCKNNSMIGIWANIIILPTGIISGILVPKEFLPDFLNQIAFLAPQYWVMDGLQKMNASQPVGNILLNMVILLLLASCVFSAGIFRFDKIVNR